MEMITRSQDNLEEIRALILLLDDKQYTTPVDILSGATIGKHVRHILEFYACVFRAESTGAVCYDERERNGKIETSRFFAMAVIENLIICFSRVKSDCPLKLKANFSMDGKDDVILETSLFRELAYNFEHAIHHQALMKVAFKELNIEGITLGHFGVSVSTVRHNNNKNI